MHRLYYIRPMCVRNCVPLASIGCVKPCGSHRQFSHCVRLASIRFAFGYDRQLVSARCGWWKLPASQWQRFSGISCVSIAVRLCCGATIHGVHSPSLSIPTQMLQLCSLFHLGVLDMQHPKVIKTISVLCYLKYLVKLIIGKIHEVRDWHWHQCLRFIASPGRNLGRHSATPQVPMAPVMQRRPSQLPTTPRERLALRPGRNGSRRRSQLREPVWKPGSVT